MDTVEARNRRTLWSRAVERSRNWNV
jgi:hypothetical protein